MAYRNQNYMTNRKIKAEVDKNQKDYVPPAVEEEEEKEAATLTIIVKNDLDELIENASVSISKTSDALTLYTGKTDSNGTYTINDIETGEYSVSVDVTDYSDIKSENLTIVEGKNEKTFVFNKGILVEAPPIMEEEEGEF